MFGRSCRKPYGFMSSPSCPNPIPPPPRGWYLEAAPNPVPAPPKEGQPMRASITRRAFQAAVAGSVAGGIVTAGLHVTARADEPERDYPSPNFKPKFKN